MKGNDDWKFQETPGVTCGYVPCRTSEAENHSTTSNAIGLPDNFKEGDGGAVRWRLNCDMTGLNIAKKKGPGELCGKFCIGNP